MLVKSYVRPIRNLAWNVFGTEKQVNNFLNLFLVTFHLFEYSVFYCY